MVTTTVSTGCGAVEGIDRGDHLEFRGIPYAAAPIGEQRFLPPQPHAGWAGVRAAQVYGTAAPQELSPLMGVDRVSDDCLYLNVWTPAADHAQRPVLVWFHGGSYIAGCGHQLLYHGARLATSQDCVVVTCNFRIGLFGFGNFGAALGGDFPAATNVGTRDQVAVLQWVRDNIAAFGGDPACVTIFGESAGGMSVATLLGVPSAKGLFQRAIVQSGGADFVVSREDAVRVAQVALDALGESRGAQIDALLKGDVAAIVKAQRKALKLTVDRGLRGATPQFGMSLMPVVDGDFLPQRPIDAIAAGAAKDVPLLASVTRDEWNLFVYRPQPGGDHGDAAGQIDEARLLHLCERALPGHGAAALAFYRTLSGRKNNGKLLDLFCWLETDRMFRVPTHRLLAAQAAQQPLVFAAQFEWESPQFGGLMGACHVVDVPFVFGGTGSPTGQFFTGGGEVAAALADEVMRAWATFARHGKPAAIGGLDWPAFDTKCQAMHLSGQVRIDAMPSAAERAFWHFLV